MIQIYPMDYTGCGYYRMIWAAEALDPTGEKIRIIPPGDHGGIQAKVIGPGMVRGVTMPVDLTAVVLQRPTFTTMVATIPFLTHAGVKVIVDVDDDLEAITSRHPTWHMLRGIPGHDPRALRVACERADLVVASTPAILKKYAPHGRGTLIRNCIPKKLFRDANPPRAPHIGWPGSIRSHPDDLRVLGNSLAQLRAPVRIVGGDTDGRARSLLGVEPEVTGSIPFEGWMDAVQTIHTGIAPLDLYAFNQAKSWLKPLEMAAVGVPFAASPTPEYIELGAGQIIRDNKPREWVKALRKLLIEPGFREDEIGRNREIAKRWILEDHLDCWRMAWGY